VKTVGLVRMVCLVIIMMKIVMVVRKPILCQLQRQEIPKCVHRHLGTQQSTETHRIVAKEKPFHCR
jgi:hypothetical protein